MSNPAMPDWYNKHLQLYLTDPAKAHLWDSSLGSPDASGLIPTLLLTVKGRKSGAPLHTPLIYSNQGAGFAVIASKGGAPDHPSWFLNLQANPEVEVQVAANHYKARARVATGAEREKIWADMVKIYPPYTDYAKYAGSANREIPVVVIDPV